MALSLTHYPDRELIPPGRRGGRRDTGISGKPRNNPRVNYTAVEPACLPESKKTAEFCPN